MKNFILRKAISFLKAFILLMPLLITGKALACDAEILSVSASQICSSGGVRVIVRMEGVPEWTFSYRAGIKVHTISGIETETYEFDLSADKFGISGLQRIQLVSSADALGTGNVDTTSFFVNIIKTAEPSGDALQEFCAISSPVVSDIVVAGSSVKWYNSSEGGELLNPAQSITEGSYWASQTISGCESEDRFLVNVIINDPAAPAGDITQVVCSDDAQTVTALNATGSRLKWYSTLTGETPVADDITISPGSYWATQTVNGCESTERLQVDFNIVSPPKPELGGDTNLCSGNMIVLDPGLFASYEWSTGVTVPQLTVTEGIGEVWVTVSDEFGCTGSDTIVVNPCNPSVLLGPIPNLFTPNGDGAHDTWVIENIGLFPACSIQVFDRAGYKVYESTRGYGNDWNGRGLNGNVLPPATYYYIIDLNVPGVDPVTGFVIIIR